MWVIWTPSTSLSSAFTPSSFPMEGSTRKDENQAIRRVNTCYEWNDTNPLTMIKSRTHHSITFVFLSLFSGIAMTQAMPSNAQSIEEWYESRPPEQLCELYRSGAIRPDQLPGGRDSEPCANFPTPDQYVIKDVN